MRLQAIKGSDWSRTADLLHQEPCHVLVVVADCKGQRSEEVAAVDEVDFELEPGAQHPQ